MLATHISGHDATTGTGERQEEEGCGAQEAGSTDQRVGPGVGAAEAAAELHAQAHTQDPSQAGDEPKDEAGAGGGAQGLFHLPAKLPSLTSTAWRGRPSIPATLTTQGYPGTAPHGPGSSPPIPQTGKLRLGEEETCGDGFKLSLSESESYSFYSILCYLQATQPSLHLGTCQRTSKSLQEGRVGSPPRPHGNAARMQEPREPGSP